VTICDATTPTPELVEQREALSLVQFLFARPLSKSAVFARLRADDTIRARCGNKP
jgi:hypothetical protein